MFGKNEFMASKELDGDLSIDVNLPPVKKEFALKSRDSVQKQFSHAYLKAFWKNKSNQSSQFQYILRKSLTSLKR